MGQSILETDDAYLENLKCLTVRRLVTLMQLWPEFHQIQSVPALGKSVIVFQPDSALVRTVLTLAAAKYEPISSLANTFIAVDASSNFGAAILNIHHAV